MLLTRLLKEVVVCFHAKSVADLLKSSNKKDVFFLARCLNQTNTHGEIQLAMGSKSIQ